MVRSYELTFHELQIIMGDFSKLVDEKVLQKMPYNMWRQMTHPSEPVKDVLVEWDNWGVDIILGNTVHHFEADDNSFGQFMMDDYCMDWERYEDGYYSSYYPAPNWRDEVIRGAFEGDMKKALSEAKVGIIASDHTEPTVEIMGLNTKADISAVNHIEERVAALESKINTNEEDKKENTTMKGFNFDFGPVNPAVVRMSMYGLAIKNKTGTFVSYDAKNDEIVDVDVLNFDGAKYIWKMPVAIKDIAIGDTIVHQNVPMFVVGISEDKKALFAVDPVVGERKEIMLTRSPFGFHFATKVINLLGGMFSGEATAENPFGNMWMLMALGDENNDMKELLPFMVMANGGMNTMNPMMFYCLMGKENVDPMALAMMMGAFNPAPAHECNCGGNCGNHN